MRRLIFGCGYLGRRVALRWLLEGDEVYAVTRWSRRVEPLVAIGVEPIVANVMDPNSLGTLPEVDAVLYAVGYDRSSAHSIRDVYAGGLRNVLDAVSSGTRQVVYVSSTGVYGQSDGQWVDEQSAANPTRDGGKACLAAEQVLAAHELGPRSIVLRMAGIYGPSRIPNRQKLLAGQPINAPSTGYLNLIHVEDAARVVVEASRAAPSKMYLVADGQPVLRSDYYGELARLLNAPPPTFGDAAGTPAATRASADKRISNDRMLRELNVKLSYPSYQVGLAAILSQEAEV